MIISGHDMIRLMVNPAQDIGITIKGQFPYWIMMEGDKELIKSTSAFELYDYLKKEYLNRGKHLPKIQDFCFYKQAHYQLPS